MPFFQVRLDELHRLRAELQGAAEQMRSTAQRLRQGGPGGLGTGGLDTACDELGQRWAQGVDRIAEGASRVQQGVSQAQQAYASTEQALAQMYAQSGGEGARNVPGGGAG